MQPVRCRPDRIRSIICRILASKSSRRRAETPPARRERCYSQSLFDALAKASNANQPSSARFAPVTSAVTAGSEIASPQTA